MLKDVLSFRVHCISSFWCCLPLVGRVDSALHNVDRPFLCLWKFAHWNCVAQELLELLHSRMEGGKDRVWEPAAGPTHLYWLCLGQEIWAPWSPRGIYTFSRQNFQWCLVSRVPGIDWSRWFHVVIPLRPQSLSRINPLTSRQHIRRLLVRLTDCSELNSLLLYDSRFVYFLSLCWFSTAFSIIGGNTVNIAYEHRDF